MTDPLTIFDCSLCDWSPYHIWLFHIFLFSIGLIPSLPLTIFNLTDPLITFNCFQFDRSLYCLRLFLLIDWSPYYLQLYSIWLITLLLLTISYIADPLITFDCPLYDRSPHYLWLFSIGLIPLITFDCSFLLVPQPPVEQWPDPTRLDHRLDRWDGSVAASCLYSPCETKEPTKQYNNAGLSRCSGNKQSLWKWNTE